MSPPGGESAGPKASDPRGESAGAARRSDFTGKVAASSGAEKKLTVIFGMFFFPWYDIFSWSSSNTRALFPRSGCCSGPRLDGSFGEW